VIGFDRLLGLGFQVDGKIEKNGKYRTHQIEFCLDGLGDWDEYISVF
jgi:hypothetical protein